MHLDIQGRHLEVTPALHHYVKEKLQKIKFYFDHIIHAHVVLSVERLNQICEVTITIEHHHFHNKIASDDMYKSIDLLFDKMERQVKKYKEVVQSKNSVRRNTQKHFDIEISGAKSTDSIEIEEIDAENKPMNNLEAILQLNIDSKHRVTGFFASEDAKHPSFLVKKEKGTFSLIFWDRIWEKQEVELKGTDTVITNKVEALKVPTEYIEDAVSFLEHNEGEDYRFFHSINAETVMCLFRKSKKSYGIIRENLN